MGFNFREAASFYMRHTETSTGGTKFPRQHTLEAHDDETHQQGGVAEYFPPKRKGGPVHVDSVQGFAPGAGSALMKEIEERHPGSPVKFMHEVKRGKNTPSSANGAHGEPTDWETWHPQLPDTVHRGFSLRMDKSSAKVINASGSTKEEHLKALHEALPEGPSVGVHWSADENSARTFSRRAIMDHRTDIPVMLHARTPQPKDIETRPDQLRRNGVFPVNHPGGEQEVPLRRGRKLEVTGISWKPDVDHPDADHNGWMHHAYSEGESKRHTAALAAVDEEDDDGGSIVGRDSDVVEPTGPEAPEGANDGTTPTSCSYCGATDFTNLTDNGRVQQATCAACGGTMSAHPGTQWTPELIGDPSNHPKPNPDPRSGGVGGAGAAANDPLVRDQSRLGASKGKLEDSWNRHDDHGGPDGISDDEYEHLSAYSGDGVNEDLNRHLRGHPLEYMDANDKDDQETLHNVQHSMENLANRYSPKQDMHVWRTAPVGKLHEGQEIHDPAFMSTTEHRRVAEDYTDPEHTLMKIHVPAGSRAIPMHHLVRYVGAPGEVVLPPGSRLRVHKVHDDHAEMHLIPHEQAKTAKLSDPEMHETLSRFGHDHRTGQQHSYREHTLTPVKHAGFKGYVEGYEGQHEDNLEEDREQHGSRHPSGGFDEDLWDNTEPELSTHERKHFEEHGEHLDEDDYHQRREEAYADTKQKKDEDIKPVASHGGLYSFLNHHVTDNDFWHKHGEVQDVPLHKDIYATQPHVVDRHVNRYLKNPGDSVDHVKQYGVSGHSQEYPGTHMPMFVKHEGNYFATEGHHRTSSALLRKEPAIKGMVFDADKHGFPHHEEDDEEYGFGSYNPEHGLRRYSMLTGADCDFSFTDPRQAHKHAIRHHDDGVCTATEAGRHGGTPKTAAVDWCAHRRTGRCWYPGDKTIVAMPIPQDRGPCPWTTAWEQQVCPISEPGPMALMHAKGSKTAENSLSIPDAYTMAKMARQDQEFAFHVTAAWSDVRNKAKRIRSEGKVQIKVATAEGLAGEVQGDHGSYENMITYRPGSRKIADWHCACKWGEWAWDRIRFHGRQCSHSLALQYEAQSRGMFGKEVKLGALTFGETGAPDEIPGFSAYPIVTIAANLVDQDEDPASIMKLLMAYGLTHSSANSMLQNTLLFAKESSIQVEADGEKMCQQCGHMLQEDAKRCPVCNAEVEDSFEDTFHDAALHVAEERRCPHCHGYIGPSAEEHHKCPHCGAPIGKVGVLHIAESEEDKRRKKHHKTMDTRRHAPNFGYGIPGWIGLPIGTCSQCSGWGCGHCGGTGQVAQDGNGNTADAVPDQNGDEGPMISGGISDTSSLHTAKENQGGPTCSGVALKAADTGRVLMLQRCHDEEDAAGGKWEFPGGHHEDGDTTSLHAGIREWEEEVGQPFPEGGIVHHTWTSPSGIYQGHVVVIPSEKHVSMKDGRVIPNPDDPKGDGHEQAAWWDIDHARKNPALREELKTGTPWKDIASAGAHKTASSTEDHGRHVFWHGTPSGDMRGGKYGLHIGSYEAARQALTARIGHPAEGTWDGTRKYGETLLAGKNALHERGEYPTGYSSVHAPDHSHYPTGGATYGDGTPIPHDAKPDIFPVRIKGEMSNNSWNPHEDSRANGLMKGQIKRGTAKRGYYYQNDGEDAGSISAVVPGPDHVERLPREEHPPPTSKTASSWDALSGEDNTPGFPYAAPLHSNSKNPGSTGFATSEDPRSWNNQNEIPDHLLPAGSYDSSSYYGTLHDEPEPALPSTDGADSDGLGWIPPGSDVPETRSSIADTDGSLTPNQFTGSVNDIVQQFQATAGAKAIENGGLKDNSSQEIAEAAQAHLKTALKDFNFHEQQELINEGKADGIRARNFGNLQIEGTHYEALTRALGLDDEDPEALFT